MALGVALAGLTAVLAGPAWGISPTAQGVIPGFLPEQSPHGTGLAVLRTAPGRKIFTFPADSSTEARAPAVSDNGKRGTSVVVQPGPSEAVKAAHARLRHLATLPAGWDGTDIARPSHDAIRDAMALASKFTSAGVTRRPRIGPDSDGSISFLFVDGDQPLADLSVHDDGTYSFFAKRGERVASSDATAIGGPIPADLAAILIG